MNQKPSLDVRAIAGASLVRWCGAIVVVVVLGLFVRFVVGGPVGDFLGGVLYTVLVAVLVLPLVSVILRRRMPRGQRLLSYRHWIAAGVALAISVFIEMLQLSSIPAQISAVFPPARLVLGSTFVASDLIAYCVGALLAGVLGALAAARANAKLSRTKPSTTA